MQGITQKEAPTDVTLEIVSELRDWRTRALNVLLTVVSIAAAPAIMLTIVQATRSPEYWLSTLAFSAVYLFLVALTLLRRLDPRLRSWGVLVVGYVVGALAFARGGLAGSGSVYMLALPVLAAILVGVRPAIVAAILSLLTFAAFAVTAHLGWMKAWLIHVDNPLALADWLYEGATFAMLLAVVVVLQWLFSRSQTRAMQISRKKATELDKAHVLLQERADELDRRARQFEAIVRVSHDTTALFEQEEMLQRTTRSIKEQFGFDTVIVYLTDKPGGEISLRAVAGPVLPAPSVVEGSTVEGATPEAGACPVQLETVIQTIRSGAPRIIQTSAQTSAEKTQPGPGGLVLPLQVRDQVIGALEVQTGERAAFSDEDIAILQTMADQIAIAIENARLFGEAQASLQELNALYRQYAAEAWRGYVQAKPEAIRYSNGTVTCPAQVWQVAREQARTSGEAVVFVGDDDGEGEGAIQSLAVPVSLRGLPIGVLGFHRPAGAGAWQPEEIAMVRMVADRLALAVENIRLLEDAQQRAHEEHLLGEITASIRASMDVDTILQTAVRGLGQAIGVDRVSVYLAPEEEAA